jgi:hypothetical protein
MFITNFVIHIPFETIQPYLDPVSQGAIMQTLLAILLGASLVIRLFWRKIHSFYLRLRGKSPEQQEDSAEKKVDS